MLKLLHLLCSHPEAVAVGVVHPQHLVLARPDLVLVNLVVDGVPIFVPLGLGLVVASV